MKRNLKLIGSILLAVFALPRLLMLFVLIDPSGNSVIKAEQWPYFHQDILGAFLIGIGMDFIFSLIGVAFVVVFWLIEKKMFYLGLIFMLYGLSGFSQELPDTAKAFTTEHSRIDSNGYTVTYYKLRETSKGFKVTTDYSCVFNYILGQYGETILSYHVENRQDRGGKFKRFTVYFPGISKEAVMTYLNAFAMQ